MKTFVLTVSKVFPSYHTRGKQPTFFKHKILLNVEKSAEQITAVRERYGWEPKLHTLRSNYDLWKNRADQINDGKAILSLRQWVDMPYKSKQEEFLQLTEINVQHAFLSFGTKLAFIDNHPVMLHKVAKNDGLEMDDMVKWFKYKVGESIHDHEYACIQFTKFKY
jgi:hypothetical protein